MSLRDINILVLCDAPHHPWLSVGLDGVSVAVEPLKSLDAGRLAASYRGISDAVVVDLFGADAFPIEAALEVVSPDFVLLIDALPPRDLSSAGQICWSGPAQLERFGSPFIRRSALSFYAKDFRVEHGSLPYVSGPMPDGSFQFWPNYFAVFGTRVSRTNDRVLSYLYRSSSGEVPLPLGPGFPILLPREPFLFEDLDGHEVAGLLCKDDSEPGAYRVITASDLAMIAGYEPSHVFSGLDEAGSWALLSRMLPEPFAKEALSYVANVCREQNSR